MIGPQAVCEEARAVGTQTGDWLDAASGRRVEFTVLIFFPWDPVARKFKGERVYFHGADLGRPSLAPST